MGELDAEMQGALAAALDAARQRGRLREFSSLDTMLEAVELFIPPASQSTIRGTSGDGPGACYVFAVVPCAEPLHDGDWYAGPVAVDGRDGLAVVLVVDEETARALET